MSDTQPLTFGYGFKDIAGLVFGKLTAVKPVSRRGKHILWQCVCVCGTEIVTQGGNLRSGLSRSCGCARVEPPVDRLNLSNFKSEYWTVLGIASKKHNQGAKRGWARLWTVRCNHCNNEVLRTADHLREDTPCRHCNLRPRGEAGFFQLLAAYRGGAGIRSLCWSLTNDEFRALTSSSCHYCGIEPRQVVFRKCWTAWGDYTYNGIDRVDNLLGYTVANCVSCCKTCNHAKGKMPLHEFTVWIQRLVNHHRLNGQ